jgi:hypothetical protein
MCRMSCCGGRAGARVFDTLGEPSALPPQPNFLKLILCISVNKNVPIGHNVDFTHTRINHSYTLPSIVYCWPDITKPRMDAYLFFPSFFLSIFRSLSCSILHYSLFYSCSFLPPPPHFATLENRLVCLAVKPAVCIVVTPCKMQA